jgi:hypothetical protein
MRMHRGFLGWGIFLILAGAIPLAVRAGYLSTDQLQSVGSLWPLILVGIGVGLVLSRTRFAFLGGSIVAATFGVMVGGLLAGGVTGFTTGACGAGTGTTAFTTRDGALTGASGSVELVLNCGDLSLAVAPGSAWRVEGQDRDGTGPNLDANNDSLSVRSRDSHAGPFDFLDKRESWRITLPDASRLDLQMTLNAGSSTLNLAGANLGHVEANLNAGAATIDLGSVHQIGDLRVGLNAGSLGMTLPNVSMTGSIEVNAGSVQLCAPLGAGLRLQTDESIVAGYDFEGHGLTRSGSTWETPGFDVAAVKIDLHAKANAGSFSLDPADGCSG